MITLNSPIRFEVNGYECFIDEADADLLNKHWTPIVSPKWNTVYIKTGNNLSMHRIVMERVLGVPIPKGYCVDHRNRNGLDNTRENLRLATQSQNLANSNTRRTNSTGLKGVTRLGNRFFSRITVNGKYFHLGSFGTPEEAHNAYVAAAKEHHGEFACAGDRREPTYPLHEPKQKPLPPLTPEQCELLSTYHDVHSAMNEAASYRLYVLADDYLARLKSIERELGFTPPARTQERSAR